MTDLRKAAEMALEALEELQGGCTDSDDGTVEALTIWCPEVIEALRQALAPTKPDRGPAYAGVRMWIGDKEIEFWVTKICIEQEMIEGMSMKLAADSCLKALKESKHD